jgi:hypothetical protein
MLYRAMKARAYDVRFDHIPGRGHEGALVARFLPEIVERASRLRVPDAPLRVSYWSVRAVDTGAYGVSIQRARPRGDAFVDIERTGAHVRVHAADGVRTITISKKSFGFSDDQTPRFDFDDDAAGVVAQWGQ